MTTNRTASRYGADLSWSRTVDRTARTAPARDRSPGSIEYWIDRLGPEFVAASDAQRLAAAESAKRAHFMHLAMRSSAARRARKAAHHAA